MPATERPLSPHIQIYRPQITSPLSIFHRSTGVALTPGRSIAVDPQSVPYGTPVWLASQGPVVTLARLVLAQDTGSAIVGAVRADYFAGWGPEAGDFAGRLKQPLKMWALWPR